MPRLTGIDGMRLNDARRVMVDFRCGNSPVANDLPGVAGRNHRQPVRGAALRREKQPYAPVPTPFQPGRTPEVRWPHQVATPRIDAALRAEGSTGQRILRRTARSITFVFVIDFEAPHRRKCLRALWRKRALAPVSASAAAEPCRTNDPALAAIRKRPRAPPATGGAGTDGEDAVVLV